MIFSFGFFGVLYFSSCKLMTIFSILIILLPSIKRKLAIYSLYLVHVYILNLLSTFFSYNIHEFLQNIDTLVLIIKYIISIIQISLYFLYYVQLILGM